MRLYWFDGGVHLKNSNPDVKERIQNTIDFMEDSLDNKIKLEDLAKIACYSMFHYHRIFKQAIGQTAMDYLRKRSLAKAARELKDGIVDDIMQPQKVYL